MRKIAFVLLLCLLPFDTIGQTILSQLQKEQLVAKIDKSAMAVQAMQCRFTQTKSLSMMKNKMQLTGTMYFCKPGKLRWQYSSPYDYAFILNGGKAYLKSAKSTTVIDVNKNKMFRQITDVIMNCMIGGNLSKSSYFKVEMYRAGGGIYANLVPLKKELKQLYSAITLYFNQPLTMVNKVEMKEKNGDMTTIVLSDIKINGSISDTVFRHN